MPITAEFTADFSQFTSAAEGAQTALGNVATAADGVGPAIEAQAQQAGRAIVEFGRTVATFATDYIRAFAEEEAATGRLTSALESQDLLTTDTIANYQKMAEQFQTTTRYSDDAITAAQTALTTIGRIGPEQMGPAIQAAVDLAARLGIGLPEAADKIARVIGSDGAKLGTLAKYLGDVDLKGKSASDIIAIFNSKFGGAAAADMETTAGKLQSINNKFDDFKGKVGGVLVDALNPLLTAFSQIPGPMQTFVLGIGALGLALAPVALAFGALVTAIGPLVPLIGTALTGALGSLAVLLGPAGLVVAAILGVYAAFKNWDAISGFVAGVYNAIKTYLVDKFNALVGAILHPINTVTGAFKSMYDKVVGHSYVPDLVAGIADEFGKLDQIMVGPVVAACEAVAGQFAMLISDPSVRGFFGEGQPGFTGQQGLVARSLYGFGKNITPEMAAAMAAGQFINLTGSREHAFGGYNVTNTFNVNGTAQDVARTISDQIMRTMKSGSKVASS